MKIAIIGFGNLGRSLAEGLVKSGTASGSEICVCDNAPEARALAVDKYGFSVTDDVNCAISAAEVIFLVVKSYVFEVLAPSIDRDLLTGKTVVSFMAGITFDKIFALIGKSTSSAACPPCHRRLRRRRGLYKSAPARHGYFP